jgi:uncharacterized protein (TIGR02448 family)
MDTEFSMQHYKDCGIVCLILGLWAYLPSAFAEDVGAPTMVGIATTFAPFLTTTLGKGVTSDRHDKVHDAKDDAAAYVASNGQINGPYLEPALRELREDSRWAAEDDPTLIQAILVHP